MISIDSGTIKVDQYQGNLSNLERQSTLSRGSKRVLTDSMEDQDEVRRNKFTVSVTNTTSKERQTEKNLRLKELGIKKTNEILPEFAEGQLQQKGLRNSKQKGSQLSQSKINTQPIIIQKAGTSKAVMGLIYGTKQTQNHPN